MKLCASSVCWSRHGRQTVYEKTKEAGFDALELLIMAPETANFHGHSLRTVSAAALKEEFSRNGLICAGLHIGGLATDGRLAGQLEYARGAVGAAVETGCSLLVMGGPDRASEPFRPYIEAVESLVPLLEETGVRLAIENHKYNWVQFIQDYEFIFDFIKSPMVGMTLDTGHFAGASVDPSEVARRFGDKVFHVHVKDHWGDRSVEMGMGTTDNRGCVLALREAGYEGYLSMELEVDAGIADEAAINGYPYMRALIGQRP